MAVNKGLTAARLAKKDEFYTQLDDIANELKHYKQHFEGKTVLCNCDDPRVSHFFHYFSYNFHSLGIKRLITTCYKNQNPDLFSQHNAITKAVWLDYYGGYTGDGVPDPLKIGLNYFKGDGDFRSTECIDLLKQADIVVTNPPFSLFREYVAQLVKYDKKFLIIGHQNAITYKEIFRLFKENKIWLGYGFKGSAAYFYSQYVDTAVAGVHKEGMISVSGVHWFTNLEHKKRNERMYLYKHYNSAEYPEYDNYDAIEVSKTSEIPSDYDGIMGVPITFMDKYCPEQFELIWTTDRGGDGMLESLKKQHTRFDAPVVNGEGKYTRILIKKRDNNED